VQFADHVAEQALEEFDQPLGLDRLLEDLEVEVSVCHTGNDR
jgi:hypothetical protein